MEDKGLPRVEPPNAFDFASQLPGGFVRPEAGFEAEIALLKAARTKGRGAGQVARGIAHLFGSRTPDLIGIGQGLEPDKTEGAVLAVNAVGAELMDDMAVPVAADTGVLVMEIGRASCREGVK